MRPLKGCRKDNKQLKNTSEVCRMAAQNELKVVQLSVDSNSAKIRKFESHLAKQGKSIESVGKLEDKIKQVETLFQSQKEQLAPSASKRDVCSEIIHEFRVSQRAAIVEIRYIS